ncbi:hypothetical protein OG497_09520 [Streptomyces sp. NBC_01242]|uniref:hypothetical protein n=1 Tax=unclassified Streptomyces TaxID=2593676 RepID=UPI0022592F2F|nr:hypothetical protein [Streptomyces sp. NBC_01242]MCX4794355.1 hypothetical protein [Streptomyces sp. NBC_01242]WSP58194.1 hypothetical protein OG306_30290 [Streptomyces sp. NBC_01241]
MVAALGERGLDLGRHAAGDRADAHRDGVLGLLEPASHGRRDARAAELTEH